MHQCFFKCAHLFLSQLDLVGNLARVYDKLSLHIDKIVVVCVLFDGQVFLEDATDNAAAPIDVVFQSFGLGELVDQTITFLLKGFLKNKKNLLVN